MTKERGGEWNRGGEGGVTSKVEFSARKGIAPNTGVKEKLRISENSSFTDWIHHCIISQRI